ncbi:hypothetical protein PTKIN_Ptkin16aG0117600 [Pterospermum kingtungense]
MGNQAITMSQGKKQAKEEAEKIDEFRAQVDSASCCRFQTLLSAVEELPERDWEVQVKHIYRECNRVADHLAFTTLLHERGLQVLRFPSPSVQRLIWEDNVGIAWARRIPDTVSR